MTRSQRRLLGDSPRTKADFDRRDQQYRDNLAAFRRWQATQPGKCEGPAVRHDGGCLRCDADAGEACRRPL